jgi:hypothetical protein
MDVDARSAESRNPSKAFVVVVLVNITIGLGVLAGFAANSLFPATPNGQTISVEGSLPTQPPDAPIVVAPTSRIGA